MLNKEEEKNVIININKINEKNKMKVNVPNDNRQIHRDLFLKAYIEKVDLKQTVRYGALIYSRR